MRRFVAVAVAVLLVTGLAGAFVLRGEMLHVLSCNMYPTLEPGDHVYLASHGAIDRGDLVEFKTPPRPPYYPDGVVAVSRVVGLPGEEIAFRDGHTYIDGKVLDEPYLSAGAKLGRPEVPTTRMKAGEYFVMGDNRSNSADSRVFGPVSDVRTTVRRVWHTRSHDEFTCGRLAAAQP